MMSCAPLSGRFSRLDTAASVPTTRVPMALHRSLPASSGAATFNYTVTTPGSGKSVTAVVTVQIPNCRNAICEGCLGPRIEGTFLYDPSRPGFPATARSAAVQLAAAALPAPGSRQAAVEAVRGMGGACEGLSSGRN